MKEHQTDHIVTLASDSSKILKIFANKISMSEQTFVVCIIVEQASKHVNFSQ